MSDPGAGPASTATRSSRVMLAIIIVAVGSVAIAYLGLGLMAASTTLGCDYYTYADAVIRHLDGQAIYPAAAARTGECGLYQYPPPFLLLVLPFAALGSVGVWPWIALSFVAFAAGCAIIPVRGWIRIAIFLLGAMGWPMVFGLRIGQVVPLLFFLSAVGWRSLHRPQVLGAVSGLGALIKVQPGLVLAWLLLRGNLRAVAAGFATIAIATVAAALIGLTDWPTFVRVLTQISSAVDVSTNLAIGAVAHRFGLDIATASALQAVNTVAMLALVVVAARWLPREPGFLLVVTASQVLSPIVWSHYALALLLPVAWLLERRQWWIILVPLSQLWLLITTVPDPAYTASYYVVIAALLAVAARDRLTVARLARAGTAAGISSGMPTGATPRPDPA